MNGIPEKNKTGLKRARFLCAQTIGLSLVVVLCGFLYVLPAHSQTTSGDLYQNSDRSVSPALNRVRTLIRANVLDLAQSVLETEGPVVLPTTQWLEWERQLWALYRLRNDWTGLLERAAGIPPAFPDSIKLEADTQSVQALIELQRGRDARLILRRLLLKPNVSEATKKNLRKNIIESYLADELLTEATVAMGVYQAGLSISGRGLVIAECPGVFKIWRPGYSY